MMTQLEAGLLYIGSVSANNDEREFFKKILRRIQGEIKYDYFTIDTMYVSRENPGQYLYMHFSKHDSIVFYAIAASNEEFDFERLFGSIFVCTDFSDEEINKKIKEVKMLQVLDK